MTGTYRYIRAWGAYCRMPKAELDALVFKAVVDGAPSDTYAQSATGVWHTLSAVDAMARGGSTVAAHTARKIREFAGEPDPSTDPSPEPLKRARAL